MQWEGKQAGSKETFRDIFMGVDKARKVDLTDLLASSHMLIVQWFRNRSSIPLREHLMFLISGTTGSIVPCRMFSV